MSANGSKKIGEEIKDMTRLNLRLKYSEVFGETPPSKATKGQMIKKIVKELVSREGMERARQAAEAAASNESAPEAAIEENGAEEAVADTAEGEAAEACEEASPTDELRFGVEEEAGGAEATEPAPEESGTINEEPLSEEAVEIHSEVASPDKPGQVHDIRLPPVGTVIQKLDRQGRVRCKCKVVEDGVLYRGKVYRSLSGAAKAAVKDLGLNAAPNGWLFWNLARPKQRHGNAIERLRLIWGKYQSHIEALVGCGSSLADEEKNDLRKTLYRQASRVKELGAMI